MRQCWTCNSEHDLDEACPGSSANRSAMAAGGSLLFGSEALAPVIEASFAGPCSDGDWIEEGDSIRADGDGGWIHVGCES